jgi:hypothetical protein
LIGYGSLDDGPVDPPRAGLLVDILETAIDHRIDCIELAFDRPRTIVATAAASAFTAIPAIAPIAAVAAAVALSRCVFSGGAPVAARTSRRRSVARGLVSGAAAGAAAGRAVGVSCGPGSGFFRRDVGRLFAGAAELRRPTATATAA